MKFDRYLYTMHFLLSDISSMDTIKTMSNPLRQRYKACLILSAVGDALGYRNGTWLFNSDGEEIHRELNDQFGCIEEIRIELPHWPVSDDTLLHLALGQALVEHGDRDPSAALFSGVVKKLKEIVDELKSRHPSSATISAINRLTENDWSLPYSAVSNDCSAAVRSMVIGLRYSDPSEFEKLMRVSIETSRMTHTNPSGFLAGFTSALFASFAIQEKPLRTWISSLLDVLPDVQQYVQSVNRPDQIQVMRSWPLFERFWRDFNKKQEINVENLRERDEFYRQFSLAGWAGASGTDSVAIAFNALLLCRGSWSDLCARAALHGGHGDATGCIAGALFGLIYGFENVPKNNYQNVEFSSELENVAQRLFDLSHKAISSNSSGPCVHFQFIPSDILDAMPKFRQWRSSTSVKSQFVHWN